MEAGLVVLWLAAFLLLGALAAPLSARMLPGLDHGAFAIPVALAVLAVVGHLVGHVAFGWPAAVAGLASLAGLSAVATRRRGYEPDPRRLAEHAAVFVVGFLLVVVLRGFDPAAAPLPVAVGEKFLDFGLLKTLGRTGTLPPEDMWFAGESVRYHYGGHMLSALLATLTGTRTAFAYNLALAGFYGTLVTAAYGLAGSLAGRASRRTAGAFGAFFVGLAGNLETPGRLLAWLLPADAAVPVARRLGLGADAAAWTPREFHYFDASRVVPLDPAGPGSAEAATEFPLFAWLNGDLHAHMMAQPFLLLAAAILVAVWRSSGTRRRLLLAGPLPPLVGLIGLLDIWSLPTVLGLTALTVFFAPETLLPSPLRVATPVEGYRASGEGRRLAVALTAALAVLVGGVLWTLPYWTIVVPGGPGAAVAVWGAWTPLGPLVLVHGAFLAAFAVYLARGLARDGIRPRTVLAAGVLVAAVAVLAGVPALGVTVPTILAGWWLLRTREDAGFEAVLIVAGAGLVLLVELVTLEGERFNVVFKPYVHVWLFWAVAAAAVVPRLAAGWPAATVDVDRQKLQRTGTVLAVVLIATTGLYAGFALPAHLGGSTTADGTGPTLDATAYLEVRYPGEAGAIRWLDDRPGQPTILTAAPASYWWEPDRGEGASAPASLTGLPTVAGWTHERQYRGADAYDRRVDDVRTMYAGDAAEQAALLAAYDVAYVYVGPAERRQYGTVTVGRVAGVEVARSWENVTVYRVDRERLRES